MFGKGPINPDDIYSYKFKLLENDELLCINNKDDILIFDVNTGKLKSSYELAESNIMNFAVGSNSLFTISSKSAKEYNLKDGKEKNYLNVLSKFIAGDEKFDNTSHTKFFVSKDNEAVYITSSRGIFKYRIGGNIVEQIVDGSSMILSDNNCNLMDIVEADNNEFIAAYSDFANEKEVPYLVRYYYDKEATDNKKNQITIYSLHEDDAMTQAIAVYQKDKKDIKINRGKV